MNPCHKKKPLSKFYIFTSSLGGFCLFRSKLVASQDSYNTEIRIWIAERLIEVWKWSKKKIQENDKQKGATLKLASVCQVSVCESEWWFSTVCEAISTWREFPSAISVWSSWVTWCHTLRGDSYTEFFMYGLHGWMYDMSRENYRK